MLLTDKQKRHLRSLAHPLKPIVIIAGNGLSESVLAALNEALDHHELVKVSVRVGDRDARAEVISAMESTTGATCVQSIGNAAVLFKRNNQAPKISLGGL
ncbi:MAG: ribosome assembly RNA-binding protein YhbY [Pseudomonadota bacterium]